MWFAEGYLKSGGLWCIKKNASALARLAISAGLPAWRLVLSGSLCLPDKGYLKPCLHGLQILGGCVAGAQMAIEHHGDVADEEMVFWGNAQAGFI